MSELSELKIPSISIEAGRKGAVKSLADQCDGILKALIDKFGAEETLNIIAPYLHNLGRRVAEAIVKSQKDLSSDAIGIASQIHFFEKMMIGVKGEPIEVSPERVVKQVQYCPMMPCSAEFCKSFEPLVNGMIEVISPGYKWTITKLMPVGDEICEWITERK